MEYEDGQKESTHGDCRSSTNKFYHFITKFWLTRTIQDSNMIDRYKKVYREKVNFIM